MIVRRQRLPGRNSTTGPDTATDTSADTGASASEDPSPTAPRARRYPGRYWEHASYWLLYVVAFGAAVLHWRAGNEALALLCAAAVLLSIRCIMRAYRAGH